MALVISLVVEASTYHGSAALLNGSTLAGERSVAMRGREHEALMPAVAELLESSREASGRVDRVICGAGPGSFTSLRIAAAIAKGIAMARGVPLVPVSSLALTVASFEHLRPGRYLAAIDAMRGESYAALYAVAADGTIAEEGAVRLVPTAELDGLGDSVDAVVIGPARHGDVHAVPHAKGAVHITNMIEGAEPADLAVWEPGYGRLAEAQVKWELEHGRPLQA